jgi:hypothetical protein
MRKRIGFDEDTFDSRSEGRVLQERVAVEDLPSRKESETMTADPDPFDEGQRAARENIPAEANPYQDGSDEHSLWAAGHETIAGEAEANESEGT